MNFSKSLIKSLRFQLIVALVICFSISCDKENDLKSPDYKYLSERDLVGMIKLGKKLENPYSVENMKTAWTNLKSNSTGRVTGNELEITTTHLYLKFKPKNDEELGILKKDSTINFYEYPLEYEILQEGGFYRDPSLPLNVPTFRYCAVSVDKELPVGVEFEQLATLFIPDEFKDGTSDGRLTTSLEIIDQLVDEALRITGNLEDKPDQNGRTQASDWRPAGRIRVWDNSINPENWRGVQGVKVKARRWFTTHEGITDVNGNYSCDGTFKRDANYSLDWERYDFALREGWLDGANINGPKKEGNWNLDFNSGANMFHARIFMAAYHYYYKDIKGLRRPPDNGFFQTQMHIRCYNEESDDDVLGNHLPGRRFLGLGSAIKIYSPDRPMVGIYATTIHELAHASHWGMSSSDYNNANDKVSESWARGVQWELTRMVWSNYRGGATIRPNYTQVVVDMIDERAPLNTGGFPLDINIGSEDLAEDDVSGYTIRQIEDALNGQRTWTGWRDKIKNSYENTTENNLDALFSFWD